MTLTTAREIVRQFARNVAGDNSIYSDSDIDRSIQMVGEDYLQFTHSTLSVDGVNFYEDDPDFLNLPEGFSPDRLIRFWIPEETTLSIVPLDFIIEKQADDPQTGLPLYAAFDSREVNSDGLHESAGSVWPTPNDDFTAYIQWVPPFTSFTAGTASPNSVIFNIANDQFRQVLMTGAVGVLQRNDAEHKDLARKNWDEYVQYRTRMVGRNGLGARISIRTLED